MRTQRFPQLCAVTACAIALAGALSSCATHSPTAKNSADSAATHPPVPPQPNEPPNPLAPNTVRVRATVVRIDTQYVQPNGERIKGVASTYTATIRIDSIFGYGMAFHNPLWAGESVPVDLPLPPPPMPAEVHPPDQLPGDRMLKIGDVLMGSIESRTGPNDRTWYSLMNYSLR